jgi:hypothetical protein
VLHAIDDGTGKDNRPGPGSASVVGLASKRSLRCTTAATSPSVRSLANAKAHSRTNAASIRMPSWTEIMPVAWCTRAQWPISPPRRLVVTLLDSGGGIEQDGYGEVGRSKGVGQLVGRQRTARRRYRVSAPIWIALTCSGNARTAAAPRRRAVGAIAGERARWLGRARAAIGRCTGGPRRGRGIRVCVKATEGRRGTHLPPGFAENDEDRPRRGDHYSGRTPSNRRRTVSSAASAGATTATC